MATPESIGQIATRMLCEVCTWLGADRLSLFESKEGRFLRTYSWSREQYRELRPVANVESPLDWVVAELVAGRDLVLGRLPDDLPPDTPGEHEWVANRGVRAHLTVQLAISGPRRWILSATCFDGPHEWRQTEIERLRLLGSLLAATVGRVALEVEVAAERDAIEALERRLRAEHDYYRMEVRSEHHVDGIVGSSAAMAEVLELIDRVAPAPSTVLLLGETGTGKELLAHAIHNRSRRRDGPLIKVDCAALPPSLIESELFGHEKGAFTGAIASRMGRFHLAAGGTIFLDEIGELPADAQLRLLRVLQEREFQPVGSSRAVQADVRVLAATHRDLVAEVRAGRFRDDLFYRLNVFPIRVPPLRSRREDIRLLTWAFVDRLQPAIGKRVVRIRDEDLEALTAYDWPGNVRELQNVVERALILSSTETLAVGAAFGFAKSRDAAPPEVATAGTSPAREEVPGELGDPERLDEMERRHIERVLLSRRWRIAGPGGAAAALGLNPSTLRSRMAKLGVLPR